MRPGRGRRRAGTLPAWRALLARRFRPDRGRTWLPDSGLGGPPGRGLARLGGPPGHGLARLGGPPGHGLARLGGRPGRGLARLGGQRYCAGNRRLAWGDGGARGPAGLRRCPGSRHRTRDGSRRGSGSPRSDRHERLTGKRLTVDCRFAGHRFRLNGALGAVRRSCGQPWRAARRSWRRERRVAFRSWRGERRAAPRSYGPEPCGGFRRCAQKRCAGLRRCGRKHGAGLRRCERGRCGVGGATRYRGPFRRRHGARGLRYARSPGAIRSHGLPSDGACPWPDPGLTGDGYPDWRRQHRGRRRPHPGRHRR
jgi:hypothetical protein